MIEHEAIMKRLGGDQELFKEFVEIFLEDAPEYLQNFEAGLANENRSQVQHAAHALKGLASNFGAAEFCRTAMIVELAATNGDLELCHDQQKRLVSLLQQLSAELEKHR